MEMAFNPYEASRRGPKSLGRDLEVFPDSLVLI
jgi:hypothetical protein